MFSFLFLLLVENLYKEHSDENKQEYRGPCFLEEVVELRFRSQVLERWQRDVLRHHQVVISLHVQEQAVGLGLSLPNHFVVMAWGRDLLNYDQFLRQLVFPWEHEVVQ